MFRAASIPAILLATLCTVTIVSAQTPPAADESPQAGVTATPTIQAEPTKEPSAGESSLSGNLFYDDDGDGSRGQKDRPIGGETIIVDQLDATGAEIQDFIVVSGDDGSWVVGGLARGTYRVLWEPSFPPELTIRSSPELQDVTLDQNTTIRGIAQTYDLDGVGSVTGIDFGIQVRPATGLPSTGTGREGLTPVDTLLIVLVGASLLTGLGIGLSRRAI